MDDYEPVPDDNPEHAAYAGSQDGTNDDGVTNEEEEDGEELFGDDYMRWAGWIPFRTRACQS